MLKNNGDGTFTEVTGLMNFHPQSGSTAAAADYNNNGLQDIYCTSQATTATNRLYSNVAASTYTDVTFSAFVMDFRRGVAQAWGDFNNNGWMDLYVGNINSNRNVFFKNNGDGTFSEAALAAGIQDVGDARTSAWLDVNNDGKLDLFTTNHVNPNRLYLNNGNETFTNIAQAAGIAGPQDGFAISWGDFDRDGDLDVLIAGHSYGLVLLRNDGGNALNFLNVTLVGDHDNKSGIGSRVTIYHDTIMQIREVNGGRGSVSQDALSVHFGLGNALMVDSMLIRWPSGMVQKLYGISSNQFMTIHQEGNVPPAIFHLVEPVPDSLYTSSEVMFSWTASFDPDSSDPVEYFLYLANAENDTIIGPLQDNSLLLQTAAWMQDENTNWHVYASDGIDQRRSWEQWEFNYLHAVIPGDANCNGIVNVIDVITTSNYIMGLNPEPYCFENADVNGDGIINVVDIIATVEIIMGGGGTFECGVSTVTDFEGNTYPTVLIGGQCWMAENLRATKYQDGSDIPTGLDDGQWANADYGAFTIYPHASIPGLNSDEEVMLAYGVLYNCYAVDDARNICPEGWYVPSHPEWTQLESYMMTTYNLVNHPDAVSNGLGNALKSCRQVNSSLGGDCITSDHPRWNAHGIHYGNDMAGFGALPAGRRRLNRVFFDIGHYGMFWTATSHTQTHAVNRTIFSDQGSIAGFFSTNYRKTIGYSVRYIKE